MEQGRERWTPAGGETSGQGWGDVQAQIKGIRTDRQAGGGGDE